MTAIPVPHTVSKPGLMTARSRIVLVGTEATLLRARDWLAQVPTGPKIVGAIVVDRTAGPRLRVASGLRVLGGIEALANLAADEQVEAAVVSLPSAMGESINLVRGAIRRAGLEERFLPTLEDLLSQSPPWAIGLGMNAAEGSAGRGWMKPSARIDIAQLIGRVPHELDHEAVSMMLRGKRVLITGAGGSIGSELAKMVAKFQPAQVQLMERAENALFEIDAQLGRQAPGVSRRAILHDVVDAEGTLRLLVELRPHVVFHAAAHKHVPLMEDHPAHAVNNNLFGTKAIADAAQATGCERFVFVSTDKAVNPTSVMGATKRLAEQYVQGLQAGREPGRGVEGKTQFSLVRFGNVLGSACSVLTIWSSQLSEGGPITITDPRMTRFFMTIPEAATLVIQAAALEPGVSSGAGVYVLDMGEPLRIVELAERFIRAHGFEPSLVNSADPESNRASTPGLNMPMMPITVTGMRPGEKLYEELAYSSEGLAPTSHPGIRAWAGEPTIDDPAAMIAELSGVRASRDRTAVLAALRRWVPQMAGPAGA
jgi:FlaA1/EpsC-like NDP-sugar epimerase